MESIESRIKCVLQHFHCVCISSLHLDSLCLLTIEDADAERRQREKAELEEYERQRKLRDEERRRREEEAWLKEQQALEELNRKQARVLYSPSSFHGLFLQHFMYLLLTAILLYEKQL